VSVSIGISLCPDNTDDVGERISFADAALRRSRAIIALGHTLGMEVLAESVEREPKK
jgi:EAL domain-containing protein (putative c-di-GMP-specific phosphodiesterase class I)